MKIGYHKTSTPGSVDARVHFHVERPCPALPREFIHCYNKDAVPAPAHEAMTVTLSGTQPELEQLFLDRYNRAQRMEAARRARQAK